MTTGGHIVGALLRADAAVTAKVPADRIKLGRLPDAVTLPALLIRRISKISRLTLKRGNKTRKIDRIAVTVRAESYADMVEIMGLVENCCSHIQLRQSEGAGNISILDAGSGPDLNGPGNSFEQTQDFKVTYEI